MRVYRLIPFILALLFFLPAANAQEAKEFRFTAHGEQLYSDLTLRIEIISGAPGTEVTFFHPDGLVTRRFSEGNNKPVDFYWERKAEYTEFDNGMYIRSSAPVSLRFYRLSEIKEPKFLLTGKLGNGKEFIVTEYETTQLVQNKPENQATSVNTSQASSSNLNLPKVYVLCGNQTGSLQIPDSYKQVSWSTGAKTNKISVSDTGFYTVSAFNGTETKSAQVHVIRLSNLLPKPTQNLVICPGQAVSIEGNKKADAWQWSNGQTEYKINLNASGTYWVESSNACNTVVDTFVVGAFSGYPSQFEMDVFSCSKKGVLLSAYRPAQNYRWDNGQKTREIRVMDSGRHTVYFEVCDSSFSQTFDVEIKPMSELPVYFPNVFTPNADYQNDVFSMVGSRDQLSDFQIKIFNRWGVLIYKSTDLNFAWNGSFQGGPPVEGIYYYSGEYKHTCSGDEPTYFKGSVTVIR